MYYVCKLRKSGNEIILSMNKLLVNGLIWHLNQMFGHAKLITYRLTLKNWCLMTGRSVGVGSRSFPIIIEFATKISVIKFDPGTNTHHHYLVRHPADCWLPITCVSVRIHTALLVFFNDYQVIWVWFHWHCTPYNVYEWPDTLPWQKHKTCYPCISAGETHASDHVGHRLPKRYTATVT